MEQDLTDEERKAIASLKRLAKRWPQSLWLFSASGTLHVMKGRGVYFRGYSSENIVETIFEIENDGGDW